MCGWEAVTRGPQDKATLGPCFCSYPRAAAQQSWSPGGAQKEPRFARKTTKAATLCKLLERGQQVPCSALPLSLRDQATHPPAN